jgi:hypothetical protein
VNLTNQFTKQQINQILNLKERSFYPTIDVFRLTAALFIGNDKTKGEWGEFNILFSDRRIHISLADFKDCRTKEDVKKTFIDVLRRIVTVELFERIEL